MKKVMSFLIVMFGFLTLVHADAPQGVTLQAPPTNQDSKAQQQPNNDNAADKLGGGSGDDADTSNDSDPANDPDPESDDSNL